jgi:hypothetical protein
MQHQAELEIAITDITGLQFSDNQSLRLKLVELVNRLINDDFKQLVYLLYRVDVNEHKVKRMLQENSSGNAAEILADLIIARQLEKINSRINSKQAGSDIEDNSTEERW